jgi:hypothetical protein
LTNQGKLLRIGIPDTLPRPRALIYGEQQITYVADEIEEEEIDRTWSWFFPEVRPQARLRYPYPLPLSEEFWRVYAEPVPTFIRYALVLQQGIQPLSRSSDLAKVIPCEDALNFANALRPPASRQVTLSEGHNLTRGGFSRLCCPHSLPWLWTIWPLVPQSETVWGAVCRLSPMPIKRRTAPKNVPGRIEREKHARLDAPLSWRISQDLVERRSKPPSVADNPAENLVTPTHWVPW